MLRASRVPDLDGLGGIRGGCGGESLPIIEGWQGGFHVLVGGRSRGLEEPLVADFGVRDRASGESLTYLDLGRRCTPTTAATGTSSPASWRASATTTRASTPAGASSSGRA